MACFVLRPRYVIKFSKLSGRLGGLFISCWVATSTLKSLGNSELVTLIGILVLLRETQNRFQIPNYIGGHLYLSEIVFRYIDSLFSLIPFL